MTKQNITVEKKHHSIKNDMLANMASEILYLSPTYPGSVHDKKICDEENLLFNKHIYLYVDLGFIGLTSETATIMIPYKNKKNKELSKEQKEYNKMVSKQRVKIEHIIGNVKINRKVKEKFRGRLFAREDDIMLISCGLHNLKIRIKNVA